MEIKSQFTLHKQLKLDTFDVVDLPLSKVLLMNDAQFPWLILVPRIANISEVFQLSQEDYNQLNRESFMVGKNMMSHFNGDKLNIGSLGNLVPQLHLHHIVRYKTDIAWPSPVWGQQAPVPYNKQDVAKLLIEMKEMLLSDF